MADRPEVFFDWFFQQQDGWGLTMYEQDWMCTEYDGTQALQANLTLADRWLKGMAHGAARSGRTVQYCTRHRIAPEDKPLPYRRPPPTLTHTVPPAYAMFMLGRPWPHRGLFAPAPAT